MQLSLFTDTYLNELNHPYTDTTLITFEYVIDYYGITNLTPEVKTNTATGKVIDYSRSNLLWVKTQIDYFNSNFTDTKSLTQFQEIVFRWYRNFGFKRWRKTGCEGAAQLEKLTDWAVDMMVFFMNIYKRRVELIRYFRNEAPEPRDLNNRKILNRGIWYSSNYEQFDYIFQCFIGSLSIYTSALPFYRKDEHEPVSLDSLIDKLDDRIDDIVISRW